MNFREWHHYQESITENTKLEDLYALNEAGTSSRYSVEVNYRTTEAEVAENFAKIALGFVGAAVKQNGYHVKHVHDQHPIRIMVSSRNWDDGEWVALVSFNPKHDGGCFVISKGFYNKDRRSVSIQSNKKCDGTSAAEITVELRKMLLDVKGQKDRHQQKLKGINMKRGPK